MVVWKRLGVCQAKRGIPDERFSDKLYSFGLPFGGNLLWLAIFFGTLSALERVGLVRSLERIAEILLDTQGLGFREFP